MLSTHPYEIPRSVSVTTLAGVSSCADTVFIRLTLLSLIQVATTRTMSTHRDSPGMTVASINVSVKTHPPEVTNVLLGRISVSGAVFLVQCP